ncbi:HAMP domain-containing histidine kinase [Candidatus Saccharibacteria bacterium]|nr:HAMP domain-containing histidine kinase [Candidatus Saccharibacteria bacterium]
MKIRAGNNGFGEFAEHRALLAALSDDLALPLLQIKTSLELVQHEDFAKATLLRQAKTMALSTEAGLQLIEAYRLALHVNENVELSLEPVSVGAVLQDVAHELTPYAKQYDTDLEVDVQGKLSPVLAHQASLFAALQCLSASMIRAQAAQDRQKRYRMMLGAHKTPDNVIATGVFSNIQGLSDRTLRAARHLIGKARQPLPNVPTGAAGGVLIADMLCSAMWQPLRHAAHKNMGGLATGVPVTKQLQLI